MLQGMPDHVKQLVKHIEATFPQYFFVGQVEEDKGLSGVRGNVVEIVDAIVQFCDKEPMFGLTLFSAMQEWIFKKDTEQRESDEPRPV